MTEILTESFCERCGTRYTFETSAPRRSRLGRMRTLSKGVRNFVLSDESSFSEAMADARSEEELSATAHQLDAFHQTFNFCLTCRQYTCGNCWNTSEGRCLTCAPIPGLEEAAATGGMADVIVDGNGNGHAEMDDGWPEADLERINAVLGQSAAPDAVVPDAVVPGSVAPEPGVASDAPAAADIPVIETPETAPAAAAADQGTGTELATTANAQPSAPAGPPTPVDATAPVMPVDAAPVVADVADEAGPTTEDADTWAAAAASVAADEHVGSNVIGVAPGQSLEDAIAAYESQLAAEEAAAQPAVGDAAAEMASGPQPAPVPDEPTRPVAMPGAHAAAPAPGLEAPEPVDQPVAAEAATTEGDATEPHPAPAASDVAAPGELPTPDRAEPDMPPAQPSAGAEAESPAAPQPPVTAAPAGTPTDVIEQPTWPVAPAPGPSPVAPAAGPSPVQAPDATGSPAAPATSWLRVAPDDGASAPQWPSAPVWPSASTREAPTTLAGRPLLPRDDASALWAASAREVLSPAAAPGPVPAAAPSPQPCVQCGLSLSANARFCRRCGSRQG